MQLFRFTSKEPQTKRWEPVVYRPNRHRSWKNSATLIPVAISIVALVISGLSYRDQHQSDKAMATAQQESAARLVSPIWNQNSETIAIQNLGDTVVSFIYVVFSLGEAPHEKPGKVYSPYLSYFSLQITVLPPCSTATEKYDSEAFREKVERDVGKLKPSDVDFSFVSPQYIVFQDAMGANWQEDILTGTLKKLNKSVSLGDSETGKLAYSTDPPIKANNCQ